MCGVWIPFALLRSHSPTLTRSALWNLKSELRAPAPLTAAQLGPQQQPQQSNWNFSFVLIIDSCGRRTRAERSSNSRSSVATFSSRISRSVQHAFPVVVVVELLVQQQQRQWQQHAQRSILCICKLAVSAAAAARQQQLQRQLQKFVERI